MKYKLGILQTHPIQYFSPWYRALAAHPAIDLSVYYAHRQEPEGQAASGFGVAFEWDVPLLEGYRSQFLNNQARSPGTDHFWGCDTPEIADIIQRGTFDAFLVSGWHVRSFWQAMRAAWKSGTPLLVRGDSQLESSRPLWKRLAKELVYRGFIPRFDGYLIVGARAKEYFLHYGASAEKMTAVPHAVDNRYFAQAATSFRQDRKNHRRDWGIPEEAVVFLFAGKFLDRKRPMDFIKAIQIAAAGEPGICALMVGEGPLRQKLESQVKAFHLPVRFTGFLNQSVIPKAFAAADVLVLPSDSSETWGLVVNEAMASGLPAVVSDAVGCGPDLVVPGQTGEVFPIGDSQALANIMKSLANDTEKMKRLAAAARLKIEDYSIPRAVEGALAALERIKKNRTGAS